MAIRQASVLKANIGMVTKESNTKLPTGISINVFWILGHSGNKRNTEAITNNKTSIPPK
jgi:hypothetical protein